MDPNESRYWDFIILRFYFDVYMRNMHEGGGGGCMRRTPQNNGSPPLMHIPGVFVNFVWLKGYAPGAMSEPGMLIFEPLRRGLRRRGDICRRGGDAKAASRVLKMGTPLGSDVCPSVAPCHQNTCPFWWTNRGQFLWIKRPAVNVP